MNQIILIGRVGKEPEIRSTQNGTAVMGFSMATSARYKKADGTDAEQTIWHSITVFGKPVEWLRDQVTKGCEVFVLGEYVSRSWDDKDGVKQTRYEVKAREVRVTRAANAQQTQRAATPPAGQQQAPMGENW